MPETKMEMEKLEQTDGANYNDSSEKITTEEQIFEKKKKTKKRKPNEDDLLESSALSQLLDLLGDFAKEVGKDPEKLTILDFVEGVRNIEDKEKQLEVLEKANPLAEKIFKETQNVIRENLDIKNPEAKIKFQTFEKKYETVGKKKENPQLKTYKYLRVSWRDGKTVRSKHIRRLETPEDKSFER